jgi:hypothetical protein
MGVFAEFERAMIQEAVRAGVRPWGFFFGWHIHSLSFLLHCSDVFGSQNMKVGTIFASRPVEPRAREGRVSCSTISMRKSVSAYSTRRIARDKLPQSDPQLKQDFLIMERRWLFLARSYEFSEQLSDLSEDTKRQADNLPK